MCIKHGIECSKVLSGNMQDLQFDENTPIKQVQSPMR